MKSIRKLALIFLILSYLSLILIFVFQNELQNSEFPYIFLFWGIGIANVVTNIFYVSKLKLKEWILILLIISGLTWAFPPLLFTFFGIPFLIAYLIVGFYIHGLKTERIKK